MNKLTEIILGTMGVGAFILGSDEAQAQTAPTAPTAPTAKPTPAVTIPAGAFNYGGPAVITPGTGPNPNWKPNPDSRSSRDFNATTFFSVYAHITGQKTLLSKEDMLKAVEAHMRTEDVGVALSQYAWMRDMVQDKEVSGKLDKILETIQADKLVTPMDNADTPLAAYRVFEAYNEAASAVDKKYSVGIEANQSLDDAIVRSGEFVVHLDFEDGEVYVDTKAPKDIKKTTKRNADRLGDHHHDEAYKALEKAVRDLPGAANEAKRAKLVSDYIATGEAAHDPVYAGAFLTYTNKDGSGDTFRTPLIFDLGDLHRVMPTAVDEVVMGGSAVTVASIRDSKGGLPGYAVQALGLLVDVADGTSDEVRSNYRGDVATMPTNKELSSVRAVIGTPSVLEQFASGVGTKVNYKTR